MKRLILCVFFMTAGAMAFAQDEPVVEVDTTTVEAYEYDENVFSEAPGPTVNPKDTEATAAYMTEDQSRKKFDDKDWRAIVGDVNYEEKPEEKEEPKKKEAREPWFKFPTINPAVLRIRSFAVIFIVLAVIIYFLARNITFSQSIKKMKTPDISAPVENIEEVDIDGLLRKALADGDLRAAVRVHYLMLLKKLNEVGLIAWKKDKTNRDYLSELYGRNDCYDDVRKLTLAYELVWYGERSVSRDSFDRISGEFASVNRQVAKDKPEA
jgi:hypothetical protein